jgi:hypothetical protein
MADNLLISTIPEPPAVSVLAVGTLAWLVVRRSLSRGTSAQRSRAG